MKSSEYQKKLSIRYLKWIWVFIFPIVSKGACMPRVGTHYMLPSTVPPLPTMMGILFSRLSSPLLPVRDTCYIPRGMGQTLPRYVIIRSMYYRMCRNTGRFIRPTVQTPLFTIRYTNTSRSAVAARTRKRELLQYFHKAIVFFFWWEDYLHSLSLSLSLSLSIASI